MKKEILYLLCNTDYRSSIKDLTIGYDKNIDLIEIFDTKNKLLEYNFDKDEILIFHNNAENIVKETAYKHYIQIKNKQNFQKCFNLNDVDTSIYLLKYS